MRNRSVVSLVLLALLLFLAACTPAQTSRAEEAETALRQLMLNWAILGDRPLGIDTPFPDGNMIARASTVVIQDDGSAAGRKLHLAGRRVDVLDVDAIRARADGEGDYLYLRFERVEIRGDEATVRLALAWALSQATLSTGRAPLNGGGAEVLFRRRGETWEADRILSEWRS